MKHVKPLKILQKKPDRLPIGTTWHANNRFGGEKYEDIEKSLYLRSQLDLKDVPNATMVQPTRARTNHIGRAHIFKNQSQYFSLRNDGGQF